MTEQQLKFFIQLADMGSFGEVEKNAFISKQAIRKQLNSLENELGFTLVTRSHSGLTLTIAGLEFYREIKKILSELDHAKERCLHLSQAQTTIRICNAPQPQIVLGEILNEFNHLYPEIKQQLIFINRESIVNSILHNQADIAEGIYNPELVVPGIACKKLFALGYRCLMSPNHSLAKRHSLNISDLDSENIAVLERNKELIKQLETECTHANLTFFVSNDIPSIYNFCYNHGIFISKAQFINDMKPLVSIPLETTIVKYSAVYYRENPSLLVQNFLAVAERYIQSRYQE